MRIRLPSDQQEPDQQHHGDDGPQPCVCQRWELVQRPFRERTGATPKIAPSADQFSAASCAGDATGAVGSSAISTTGYPT